MKKHLGKVLLCAAAIVIALFALSSCGVSNSTSYISDEERAAHILELLGGSDDTVVKQTRYKMIPASEGRALGITGMVKLSENSKFILYMDFTDTSIAVYDRKTKTIYHSDPSNAGYLEEGGRSVIASPIAIEAYDALNKRYEFNFYDNCFADENFVIADMGDGKFRIIYTVGNDPNKDLAPPVLTVDTYENLYKKLEATHPEELSILKSSYKLVTPQTITLEEKESLIQYYPTLDWQTLYVRRSLTTRQRASLTEAMQLAGFTAEQVKAEMEKTEYQGPERSVMYTIPVDITLTKYGLEVNVDSSLILAPSEQRLYKISLYRGLGASDSAMGGEYLLVPDGSGAVIPARGSLSTLAYSERIYGNDETLAKDYDTSVEEYALTAFGVYDRGSSNGAFAAIMSEGASQSYLTARPLNTTSNLTTSLNYDIVYGERDYRSYLSESSSSDSATSSASVVSGETGTGVVLSKDSPEINFTVKYYFLEGGQTYSDYAEFYREYLIKEGILPSETTNEKGVSLYLDLLGAFDKNETVAGIPTTKKRALTTYAQAQEILTMLADSGVENIKARYSYWSNGGYYNNAFNTVRLLSEMGSQNDLKALVSYCTENSVSLYPTADFMYIYRETMGDGMDYQTDVARRLDLRIARVNQRNYVTGIQYEDADTYKSIISPDMLPGFADSYKTSYENTVGLTSISLGSFGKYLDSSYKTNRIVNREEALAYQKEVLEKFADYSVAVSNGNDYTWKYADAIYEIPTGSSEYTSSSESVPFIQMVLHGYIPYASEAFNTSGDYETEILKAVETGSNPSFRWMYAENTIFDNTDIIDFYSVNYKYSFDRAVEIYKQLNEAMSDVVNLPITKHEHLTGTFSDSGAPADGVYATTYGDDYKTFYVNYNKFDVTLADGTTVAAKSYTWR